MHDIQHLPPIQSDNTLHTHTTAATTTALRSESNDRAGLLAVLVLVGAGAGVFFGAIVSESEKKVQFQQFVGFPVCLTTYPHSCL